MMNVESRSKWQIRIATLGVFVLGVVAGGFALNAYYLWFGAPRPVSRQVRYEEAFNKLSLNDGQKTEIQKIFSETRESITKMRQESEPRVQEIRAANDEKLQKVLTPEQWQMFQQERDKIKEAEKLANPTPRPLNLQ